MLPFFRPLAGAAPLFLEPPFVSSNLSMRYLPVAADPATLAKFVEAYLSPGGSLPDEVAHFRPSAPFVLVIVATHPHLASESDETWLSQHELAFSIPLISRSEHEGRGQASLAWTQPFVFLDDALGLATGRQVWGWPKAMAEFPTWAADWSGSAAAPLVRMQMPLPSTVTGPQQQEPILEVMRTALDPQSILAGTMKGWTEGLRALAATWGGRERADPRVWWQDLQLAVELGADGWASMLRFPPVLNSSVATLQQFRDVDEPTMVSYQALVRSTMQTERVRSFQLLGIERMMLGDPSGGLRLRIAEHATQPIVSKLGLIPERVEADDAGRRVSSFAPLWPMEIVADVRYGMGAVDCWRRSNTGWLRPLASPDAAPVPFPGEGAGRPAHYDLARGTATQAEAPPFDYGMTEIAVLELPARVERLQALVDDWFDGWEQASRVRVPKDATVSLVLLRSLDASAHVSVSFQVPVDLVSRKGAVTPSFVAPFEYTNRATAAITGQEVEGRRLAAATIDVVDATAGEDVCWRVDAQLPIAADDGQQAVYTDVAWISFSDPIAEAPATSPAAMEHAVRSTIDRSRISLLQLPSTAFRGRAVVRRLVSTPVVGESLRAIGPIRGQVRLPSYPSQSIATVLGLRGVTTSDGLFTSESLPGLRVQLQSRTGRGITLPSP